MGVLEGKRDDHYISLLLKSFHRDTRTALLASPLHPSPLQASLFLDWIKLAGRLTTLWKLSSIKASHTWVYRADSVQVMEEPDQRINSLFHVNTVFILKYQNAGESTWCDVIPWPTSAWKISASLGHLTFKKTNKHRAEQHCAKNILNDFYALYSR